MLIWSAGCATGDGVRFTEGDGGCVWSWSWAFILLVLGSFVWSTFIVWFVCFQPAEVVALGQCVDERIPGRRDLRIPPLHLWENGHSSASWVLHAGAGPSDFMCLENCLSFHCVEEQILSHGQLGT